METTINLKFQDTKIKWGLTEKGRNIKVIWELIKPVTGLNRDKKQKMSEMGIRIPTREVRKKWCTVDKS
jgi:hypothetical protein